jgi:hypothetical protein
MFGSGAAVVLRIGLTVIAAKYNIPLGANKTWNYFKALTSG